MDRKIGVDARPIRAFLGVVSKPVEGVVNRNAVLSSIPDQPEVLKFMTRDEYGEDKLAYLARREVLHVPDDKSPELGVIRQMLRD